MPAAKSVLISGEAARALDRLAIPRIAELGIQEAYRKSMLEVDAMAAERFPVTRKDPPFRLTAPRGRA